MAELVPKVPGLVSEYLPQLKYLLIDENNYSETVLAELKNLVAAVIRFEHPSNDRALIQLIDQLNDWLSGQPELKRIFAIWIRSVLLRQSKNTLVLPKINDLKELKMTLAERFEEWAKSHEQKGMEKGMEKGEALVLQRQLIRRFGPLPNAVLTKIATADRVQLELWCDRVLDAASLDDVFG
ncbi:DUF4351 domain-containing protein [Methylomonas rapida]|uniref:DUF4351 domain-containing protein n=1 Tax=Methylomonas rapida TaxID=2963939 RepID=A0ABY7GLM5_9GAMM|nr:DUF4351 domain-containing protein [Methylomonas rapida]WAR45402.1 DUF4351 domain-containing protein [Methylomonas rapida]